MNKKINYSVYDFVEKDNVGEQNDYILNKTCIIFNKTFNNEPLEISIYKDFNLSEYITQINEYIHWLGGDCKDELIHYFNREMTFIDERADNEWYETLEIYRVSIKITQNKILVADITCGDNILLDHILEVEIEGNEIFSMNYDG